MPTSWGLYIPSVREWDPAVNKYEYSYVCLVIICFTCFTDCLATWSQREAGFTKKKIPHWDVFLSDTQYSTKTQFGICRHSITTIKGNHFKIYFLHCKQKNKRLDVAIDVI